MKTLVQEEAQYTFFTSKLSPIFSIPTPYKPLEFGDDLMFGLVRHIQKARIDPQGTKIHVAKLQTA